MVNKCVVPGCKAGYAETKNEIKTETNLSNFRDGLVEFHSKIRYLQKNPCYVKNIFSRLIFKPKKKTILAVAQEKRKVLLSSGKIDIGTIQFDKIDIKQEFTLYVSMGGLMKPSDVHLLTSLEKYQNL